MALLQLTQTELTYLARMNHDNLLALRFLKGKGRQTPDLSLSEELERKFLGLLPEGIPDVLEQFRSKQLKRGKERKSSST